MPRPVLMLNIAWMNHYRGLAPWEALNFLPYRGPCYGYAPVGNGSIN
jgi:hypothetical protein